MLGELGGNRETVEAVQGSLGKAISEVTLKEDVLDFTFSDGSGLTLRDDGQSCCESRYMRTDDDLAYYAGATLTDLALRDAPPIPAEYAEHEVQFLDVTTSKGVFTCSSHNEHNGYYGGFYIIARTRAARGAARDIARGAYAVADAMLAERAKTAAPRLLARNQPCGCVVCDCRNEAEPDRCLGCGAKNCGTHPAGQIPNPVYVEAAHA